MEHLLPRHMQIIFDVVRARSLIHDVIVLTTGVPLRDPEYVSMVFAQTYRSLLIPALCEGFSFNVCISRFSRLFSGIVFTTVFYLCSCREKIPW